MPLTLLLEHKNADFVLEKPENEGSEGQKSTKTTILCSGGLVCALSTGQQPVGNRKHPAGNQKQPAVNRKDPAGNQKKTACNQKTTVGKQKKTAGHQKPTAWYQKRSAGAPRWSAGRPLCKYSDCGLLELVAVHGDEELLVIDCLLQSVLHKFHSLYAIHIRQVVAQYPYSVYILRTVEKIISTGRT